MSKRIKLYDHRDYDFYNPKPYILHLLKFMDIDAQRSTAWYLDDDKYDYLFDYINLSDQNKKQRKFKDNFADIIKTNDINRFIDKMESLLNEKANDMANEIQRVKSRIKDTQEHIEKWNKEVVVLNNQLKELEDAASKYTSPDN